MTPPTQLSEFQKNRRTLSQMAVRLAAAFRRLGGIHRADVLQRLSEKLDSERFRILVLGELKRGKSSLINALLAEDLLPVDSLPCTAAILEIKESETRKVVLHFCHPLPENLPEDLPPPIKLHFCLAEEGPLAPLEVPFELLADCSIIRQRHDLSKIYSKIEVFVPLEFCRNGIEIVDSPGLNEDQLRTWAARQYIPQADAILFVLSSSLLGAATEFDVIQRDLREIGHKYLFLICNRFDEIRPADREKLIAFGKKKLAGYTELGNAGVFFLSALEANSARVTGNSERLEESGVPEFARSLFDFLQRERVRVKLLQPTLRLLQAIDDLRNRILPEQCEMLAVDVAVLETKIAEARPRLAEVERGNALILADLDKRRLDLRQEVENSATQFLRQTAERIEGWIDELELENRIGVVDPRYDRQVEALAQEISSKVGVLLDRDLIAWKEAVLVQRINERTEAMMKDIDPRVEASCIRMEEIRSGLTQVRASFRSTGEPSDPERVAAAVGGLLAAGFYSAAHGARFGFKGLGTTILTQIALCTIFNGLLGISNLLILIPMLLAAGYGAAWWRAGDLTQAARREISKSLTFQFLSNIETTAKELAEMVHTKTQELVSRTRERLELEAHGLKEQMRTILEDKKAGEQQVQNRQRLLVELDEELRQIDAEFHPMLAMSLADRTFPSSLAARELPDETSEKLEVTYRILFLSSDPAEGLRVRLRLDRELREISEQKGLSKLRDRFELRSEGAVRPKDVTRVLHDFLPNIVHFSGHGDKKGAIFVDGEDGAPHAIQPKPLAQLFELFADHVQCVVLNACYSEKQAAAISKKVRYAIGMRRAIPDKAAINFSIGFYQALGAGRSIAQSFASGRALMGLESPEHSDIPALWTDGQLKTIAGKF